MIVPIKKIDDVKGSPIKTIELFLDEDTNTLRGVKNNGTIIDFGKSTENNNSSSSSETKLYTKQDLIKNTIIFG
jgi:hypothetical protein